MISICGWWGFHGASSRDTGFVASGDYCRYLDFGKVFIRLSDSGAVYSASGQKGREVGIA